MAQQTTEASGLPHAPRSSERLPFVTKVAYGLGDFASQLMWSLASSYLALFYTDNVGLAAGAVSVLLLVARIADAVFDPVMGAYAERHTTRYGRFRPWLLYASPILAVSVVLTFMTVPGGDTPKLIWAGITYLFMGFMYSAVNLPYGALSAVMTRDSGERVALNSYRMIGTNLGAVALSAATMPLVLHFSGVGDGESTTVRGYTITAAIMALVAVPLFWLVFAACREIVQPEAEQIRVPLREAISVVLHNKPLMLVTLALFLALGNVFGRIGVATYYYIYVMGRYDLIALMMMLPSIAGAVGIALFARLATRLGKKRTVILSLVCAAVPTIVLFFVDPSNIPMVATLNVLYGLGNFAVPVLMSMVPDSIDYAEDRTGVRSDGIAYATTSMGTKIASGLSAAIGLALLGAFGYVANADQSQTALTGINFTVNIFPALLSLLAIIPIAFYPLTEEKYEQIRERLKARHADPSA